MPTIIKLKGVRGGADKTGLAELTAAFHVEGVTYDQALVIALPVNIGLPEDNRTIEDSIDDQNFTINVTFKGVVSKPDQKPENSQKFRFEEELVSKPIEAFPKLKDLMSKGGGTKNAQGKIDFPLEVAPAKGSTTGLGGNKSAVVLNEMYGVTTFQELHVVAVHTYTAKKLPADFRKRVGTIRKGLPAIFGLANDAGDWLIRPSEAEGLGETGWLITDRYVDVTNTRGAKALADLLVK